MTRAAEAALAVPVGASREMAAGRIVAASREAGVSPELVNAGMWYAGRNIAGPDQRFRRAIADGNLESLVEDTWRELARRCARGARLSGTRAARGAETNQNESVSGGGIFGGRVRLLRIWEGSKRAASSAGRGILRSETNRVSGRGRGLAARERRRVRRPIFVLRSGRLAGRSVPPAVAAPTGAGWSERAPFTASSRHLVGPNLDFAPACAPTLCMRNSGS